MENLKFSIFDIFAYLLPGAVVLAALVIISTPETKTIAGYIEILQNSSLGLGVTAILIAYIIGNVIDNFGSWLYYKLGCKIWGDPYSKDKNSKLSHVQQRALVRQYSPENYAFLQTWKTLKTMSHNLSFAVFLIMFVSILRYISFMSLDWLVLGCASAISAIILLNRANIYDKWHHKQMLEIIAVLNLEKRAKLDSSTANKLKKSNAA